VLLASFTCDTFAQVGIPQFPTLESNSAGLRVMQLALQSDRVSSNLSHLTKKGYVISKATYQGSETGSINYLITLKKEDCSFDAEISVLFKPGSFSSPKQNDLEVVNVSEGLCG